MSNDHRQMSEAAGVPAPTTSEPTPSYTWRRPLRNDSTTPRACEAGQSANVSGTFRSIGDLAAVLVQRAAEKAVQK